MSCRLRGALNSVAAKDLYNIGRSRKGIVVGLYMYSWRAVVICDLTVNAACSSSLVGRTSVYVLC